LSLDPFSLFFLQLQLKALFFLPAHSGLICGLGVFLRNFDLFLKPFFFELQFAHSVLNQHLLHLPLLHV